MKKYLFPFVFVMIFFSQNQAGAAYRSFDQAAGVDPAKTVDKTQLEGWITQVDYRQNRFRLMDPRGFERSVTPKSGSIADYHLGDHVKVTMEQRCPWATSIEKIVSKST